MTLSEKAYLAIRRDIIQGKLAAGQPLRMADLSERYAMGFSPLREALSRLQVERLVVAEALRGFKVAPLSVQEMQDAIDTRILVESDALRLSIQHGDDDWSAAIVAALYALNLQVERSIVNVWDIEARHYAFHRALLAACQSPWRLEFFERLYATTERYRIPILIAAGTPSPSRRDIQAEHSAIADAVLAHDAETAVRLLAEHYTRTAMTISARMATVAA
ncbi:FCD domain-containing protein [Pseudotabrizicola alkalilacus]|uniref:FCD domain-containing protein n=1 Tax=Pseudotabrizicola alkalilacus TaxID=2305252 RepID=A0A411YYJ3_9RHOB|nr:FCD domain-containing protein [Pseudotabrizicola alkalilacus]RGP35926.1 FCD domain-containing protein [Pseudotabrizicola alkalilacus]